MIAVTALGLPIHGRGGTLPDQDAADFAAAFRQRRAARLR